MDGGDHSRRDPAAAPQPNLLVAFNEQVLLHRHRLGALEDDAVILLENMWATHPDEAIQAEWAQALEELSGTDYRIIEVPMYQECLKAVEDPRLGKNMFVLGMLTELFDRDVELIRDQIAFAFRKKAPAVTERNVELLELGREWARSYLDFRVNVPAVPSEEPPTVIAALGRASRPRTRSRPPASPSGPRIAERSRSPSRLVPAWPSRPSFWDWPS